MTDTAARAKAFVEKWQRNQNNERQTAQEHFIGLCHLLGVKTPNDIGETKATYTFEKPMTKTGGGAGFADVWMHDHFAWEYKTKGKYATLRDAYTQLLLYKEDLGNPPILIVSDIARIEVHIAFTGYPTRVIEYTNADLLNVSTRELLRQVFVDPEQLRPVERAETITEQAAGRFAQVARFLEARGVAPTQIAPFFMKILFALFAEDVQLLPAELMSQSLRQCVRNPDEFPQRAKGLFRAMREGGYFGLDKVPRFNGWLFNDDDVLPLTVDELQFLADAARLDWAAVEPAIFGTLFERGLDPAKRAQLGAHYTSRSDILLIVEPVLMAPLRREWATAKEAIEALRGQWEAEGMSANRRRQLQAVAEGVMLDVMERLSNVRVLDPACGSGNFLYVALACLKDLEKEVWTYAGGVGLAQPDLGVTPAQLFGIEKNAFAAELAQVVVWIGYLQWLKNNGFLEGPPPEPILQSLHNIENRDAILTVDLNGQPAEPPWPEVDVIVGNPPFLGDKKMRGELGSAYVDELRKLYEGRVPGSADLVTYWFERSRALIAKGRANRVGLLATQGIRGGANRKILERIKDTGNIFLAWSDRPWILDGAVVHVSMVGFDGGVETEYSLNGIIVDSINPDLTSATNLNTAQRLGENKGISFIGISQHGPFEIDRTNANLMISSDIRNAEVVRPIINAAEIAGRLEDRWVVDFVPGMSLEVASSYQAPFKYVKTHVLPVRQKNNRKQYRDNWWIHGEARPAMRAAIQSLSRFIVTPRVSKHRLFVWMTLEKLSSDATVAIAREDDYFFGVLHSRLHELWARRTGTQLREAVSGFRYTPSTTFETFPFPFAPGKEPQGDQRVAAIAEAARELVQLRDVWLAGGDPATTTPILSPTPQAPSLKDRTLTNLYNKRPDWLDLAHKRLDAAVFAAYGWPHDLSDDQILEHLLTLNLERAAQQGAVPVVAAEAEDDIDSEDK